MRLILASLVLFSTTARAQDWECLGPYTHAEWRAVMDDIDASFAAFDVNTAGQLARDVRDKIRCLDQIVLPSHLGRYARQMALVAFFEQDEINAVRWGMLQRYATPGMPWPEDLPSDHPMRRLLDTAAVPSLAGPDRRGLAFPKNGAVFMNGYPLEYPLARSEVPNLLQLVDRKGEITLQYWQDGAAFREDVLSDDPMSQPTTPKWFVPEDPSEWGGTMTLFGGTMELEDAAEEPAEPSDAVASAPASTDPDPASPGRERSTRTLNLAAAGGMMVVSGSLYTVSSLSLSGLEQAQTTEELGAARSRVNALAIGAGIAGLAGVGLGITAFVDGHTVGMRWTF